jgi:hypothetical protein
VLLFPHVLAESGSECKFSSLDEGDKKRAIDLWEKRWKAFIDELVVAHSR